MNPPAAVAILDYDAGNLTSVAYAVRHLGTEPRITRDPEELVQADRVIFPGVGAAGNSMAALQKHGLADALREVIAGGRPVLGICVGCQVQFDFSEEDGGTSCLGLMTGKVRKFEFADGVERKVPHMGWNEVTFEGNHPLFQQLERRNHFYFVHSYYPNPDDPGVVQGTALYGGIRFAAAVGKDNLIAVQFHTEKSGAPGLDLLNRFLSWTP